MKNLADKILDDILLILEGHGLEVTSGMNHNLSLAITDQIAEKDFEYTELAIENSELRSMNESLSSELDELYVKFLETAQLYNDIIDIIKRANLDEELFSYAELKELEV